MSKGGDTYDNGVPIVVRGGESPLQGEGEQVIRDNENREVREMRSAATVLSIIHERGKQGLPLEDIYRQLYNPGLYLMAYGRLYANTGAMTPGTTPETVDGMSMAKIEKLIDDLRHERYRWTPVRRTYIAKKNGKLRGLGLPTWSDKLLQEVIRLIRESRYSRRFCARRMQQVERMIKESQHHVATWQGFESKGLLFGRQLCTLIEDEYVLLNE